MIQLKEFQELVLEKLDDYLDILKEEYTIEKDTVEFQKSKGREIEIEAYCRKTWDKLNKNGKLPSFRDNKGNVQPLDYIKQKDGLGNLIPNICLKVPTGGGKTLLGVSAVEKINTSYFSKNTGLVLWIVPTEAIYRQTIKNFKDREHPYRKIFERASAGRVKILEKTNAFSLQDIQEYLCVMVIMLQSTNRETKESLRVFKDSGRFTALFPQPDDYKANNDLLDTTKNLDIYEDKSKLGGVKHIAVKHSLGNAMRVVKPVVILDEGHRAYSDLARKTICGLNPRFILELSATPNMKGNLSNILVSVSGVKLKEEEMIKLPINIINADKADWKKTLCQAYEKLKKLDGDCEEYYQESKRYIRPIMLIQVERTGKEQRDKQYIHTEDVKEYLIKKLGIDENAIRIKTAEKNELKDESLLCETSQVQFIITKHALQEGWDCPYAYILAILSNAQSKKALTQLIGRILRQPYAQRSSTESLNESYVFCYNQAVGEVVEGIKKGLQEEGMGDLINHIRGGENDFNKETVARRKGFKRTKVFLPRVLHKDKKSWRNIRYESDILQHIDFSKMSYRKKNAFTPDNIDELQVNYIKLDIEDHRGNFSLPYSTGIEKESIEMDFAYMVRRLSETVPNPWQASSILEEAIDVIKANDVSDEKIYLNRVFLLDAIEKDLKDQVNEASEKIFIDKLENGEICFKIFKDSVNLNWEMATKIDFFVSKDDKIFRKENESPLQLSLFEKTFDKHYNKLEKDVAWYLDEKESLKWWHRMVARQDYYLQGWQARKVYPDFLACVDKDNANKISVLETKGDHLKGNDDTKYKEDLFNLLKKYDENNVNIGTVETASEDETEMVFEILLEKDWHEKLQNIL